MFNDASAGQVSAEVIGERLARDSRRPSVIADDASLAGSSMRLLEIVMADRVLRITIEDAVAMKVMVPVARRIGELLRLPANWDSYGARTIRLELVQAGLELLGRTVRAGTPPPAVVPTGRGGLQFEWHLPHADLEIEVTSASRFAFVFEDTRTGESTEGEAGPDGMRGLEELVGRLATPA
jgi:hypothetical protein